MKNIFCKIFLHKWNKSPKIEQYKVITDKHCDAVYQCEKCGNYKVVSFNCYTGEVYKTSYYTKEIYEKHFNI